VVKGGDPIGGNNPQRLVIKGINFSNFSASAGGEVGNRGVIDAGTQGMLSINVLSIVHGGNVLLN
jgi:hypothetical protein